MKPTDFEQQTAVIGKDQPEYQYLPAYVDDREFISCWKLTFRERFKVLLTGQIWNRQMIFGNKFAPTLLQTENPWDDDAKGTT